MHTFSAATGDEIQIRYPLPDDTAAMHTYINALSKEKTFVRFQGEEISFAEEEEYLKRQLEKIAQKKAVLLLAFLKTQLIGSAHIEMHDKTSKHVGLFGLSVAKAFRGKGIGSQLMRLTLEEAKQNLPDLEIVTLGLFSPNHTAKALYEKFGFQQYGCLPGGVKLATQNVDLLLMYKQVKAS